MILPSNHNVIFVIFQKTFTFTHYEFDKSVIPKFALTGMYRVQYVAKKDNIVMSGVEIIVDLS